MATLTQPSVGLVQSVLGVLADARSWEGDPVTDTFARLLSRLRDDEEAAGLGEAIGEALLPLRFSPDSLHLALDIVLAYNLYECWPGLERLLREPTIDGMTVVTAAALAGHPGVPPLLSDLVQMTRTNETLAPWQRRLVALRLSPEFRPRDRLETIARAEQWPGAATLETAPTPLVLLHESAGRPLDALRLAHDLRSSGCAIRRLPQRAVRGIEARWSASWVPLIAQTDRAVGTYAQLLPHGVVVPVDGGLSASTRARILRDLQRIFPHQLQFRRMEKVETSEPIDILQTDAFNAGAYNRYELAFLIGTRRAATNRFIHEPELQPRTVRGTNYWTFSQLVAIRTWRFFDAVVKRPLGKSVAGKLVTVARGEQATLVGVTEDGRVLVQDDGDLVDVETGQTVIQEIVGFSDRVFRPFHLGGGRVVPDLLMPTHYTSIHPLFLRGAPTVSGTRITVAAVNEVANVARSTGADWRRVVVDEFPELNHDQATDADRLARRVLAS